MICAIGDTHGHLQLALCMAARWQRELGVAFDAVLLCGDVGTFTDESQLDNATRRHGKTNPCELEFLSQWSIAPQPDWLQKIFRRVDEGGFGLECPIVMVHGNHEGFEHLKTLRRKDAPSKAVSMMELPGVDSKSHIRYLPSGWTTRTPAGLIVGGVGGIEKGQRCVDYDGLAYVSDEAVIRLLEFGKLDVLITHQGPRELQGEVGSALLQLLLDSEIAKVWFHGHSVMNPAIVSAGPNKQTVVCPLGDIAFAGKGPNADDPGENAVATASFIPDLTVKRTGRPANWREFRRRKWRETDGGLLVCPSLI